MENIRGLNLASVKLMNVQVTKRPLKHKKNKTYSICFAKRGLTQVLYTVHKEEFSVPSYVCGKYTWQSRGLLVRDNPTLSSERMLHKICDRKRSVAKINLWYKSLDRLRGLVVRVPGYRTEMYCASCEVRTEFIYVM
jgi:hypothetical protein